MLPGLPQKRQFLKRLAHYYIDITNTILLNNLTCT